MYFDKKTLTIRPARQLVRNHTERTFFFLINKMNKANIKSIRDLVNNICSFDGSTECWLFANCDRDCDVLLDAVSTMTSRSIMAFELRVDINTLTFEARS